MDTRQSLKQWASGDFAHVPFALYSDPDIFDLEMERIFEGASWAYVGLAAEIPEPGDFRTTAIGNRSVIICRDRKGVVNGFVNRCSHKGVKLCREKSGNQKMFTCPYHRWNYDLQGNLRGVPFIRGVKKQGGMPADFDMQDHGLPKLQIAERNGVIFASMADKALPGLDDYLGESNRHYFDRVFDGRDLHVLGYSRQLIPANWKLMFENIKDPYHASLLHVFLVSFGLFRADQKSGVKMDESGKHGLLISQKGEQKKSEHTTDMQNLRDDLRLSDPRLLDPVREFNDEATVVMQTVWPNLIVQQQSNTLALRQLLPRDSGSFELHWTFFGYADDDEVMTTRRLRQANLMSSAGLVSGDDSEVLKLTQDGVTVNRDDATVMLLGGTGTGDEDHMVTETAIRAFYKHYREVMQL